MPTSETDGLARGRRMLFVLSVDLSLPADHVRLFRADVEAMMAEIERLREAREEADEDNRWRLP